MSLTDLDAVAVRFRAVAPPAAAQAKPSAPALERDVVAIALLLAAAAYATAFTQVRRPA